MPLIEFLLPLLLLLRAALLDRRSGPDQRMRPFCSRPVGRLRIGTVRPLPVLRLRSSLLLVSPGLRLRELSYLMITTAGLNERPEAIFAWRCRRRQPSACICRSGLRGPEGTNQGSLIQMSARLRLPLFDGRQRRGRRPDRHYLTAHNRCRRPDG